MIDPHFRTFNEVYFSYHGQCDLVLSRSSDFADGLGLHIHIRTTRVDNPHIAYSYISGVAVRIGSNILEIFENGEFIINGEESRGFEPVTLSGYNISISVKGSNKRIIVFDLDLFNERSIQIRSNTKNNMLFVDVNGAFVDSEGLLGPLPMEDNKLLLARDGITDLTGYWNTYGEEWQVKDTDFKLFQDGSRHPQYPNGCEYIADKSHHVRRRLQDTNQKVDIGVATKACSHLIDTMRGFCIDDIMATGDVELAEDPFYSGN